MRARSGNGLVVLLVSGVVVGCGSGAESGADAGVPPQGLAAYDSTATLLRGPWLTSAGPGAITVSWSTDQPARSRVELGAAAAYGTTAEGTVTQPPAEDPGETTTSGWQHRVTVSGLDPETSYHYRIVSLAEPTADAVFSAPAASGGTFVFALFGDVRTDDDAHAAVVEAMLGEAPDFVVHTGDFCDVGGDEVGWTDFFALERELLAATPVVPVYGNHEDFLGRTLFDTFFPAPPGARSPRTYAVDWGDLHLAVLDRYESDLADEAAWLEADLTAAAARLRIVALHPPLYTFSNHEPDLEAREALWPILRAHDVRLVVSGHNHVYERFFVDGIQLVVTGGGGAPLYGTDDHVDPAQVDLRRAAAGLHHYVRAEATPAGYRFEARPVPAGAPLDCFVIDPTQPGVDLACP